MNNNIKNGIEGIDFISIYSLMKQLENLEGDKKEAQFIRLVIQSIAYEIEKLHQENKVIIKQNKEIIDLLK